VPKKINRNPGIAKRGDRWQARAYSDGIEKTKTFSTQDEAVRWYPRTDLLDRRW